jgi:hypothetical protein
VVKLGLPALLVVLSVPASAFGSEPFFSYVINLQDSAESGGGVVPRRPHPGVIINESPQSVVAADCYSTDGDIPAFAAGSPSGQYGVTSCHAASSFNVSVPLSTMDGFGSSFNTVAGSVSSLTLSVNPSMPPPTAAAGVSGQMIYVQIFNAPPNSQVALTATATAVGLGRATIIISTDCPAGTCSLSAGNSGAGTETLETGPLLIGPSGQYTVYAALTAAAEKPGNLGPNALITLNFCPLNLQLSLPNPQSILATVTAPGLPNLNTYAAACGFSYFNWQQTIQSLPSPSPFFPAKPNMIPSANKAADGSLLAPPPFFDPVPGSYTYIASISPAWNPAPYYYPTFVMAPGQYCTLPLGLPPCTPGFRLIMSTDSTALSFADLVSDIYLMGVPAATSPPAGQFVALQTTLVGVDGMNNATPLIRWSWNSTFNGTAGGISQTAGFFPVDPGSGTGGVTITSINGVQFPDVVPASSITTTASGLAYSRVTRTFDGTVTITNISSSAISGPLQILFLGLTTGVTLQNATENLSGTPYLTVPVTSLQPGQSTTVNVQFQNPSNATVDFSPVIYSGSIN